MRHYSFTKVISDVQWAYLIWSEFLHLQVEAALASSNYVDNIMVHADPYHNYCVALVVPSHNSKTARKSGIQYKVFSELCRKDQVVTEVQLLLSKVSF